ncbi:hypothetical protein WN093_12035 [Gammaproteobacteria bacterium AS21]
MDIKVVVREDLVVGRIKGGFGLELPSNLNHLSNQELRLVDGKLVDVSKNTDWYVDEQGLKHVSQKNNDWQYINCLFDDFLIEKNNQWSVLSEQDLFVFDKAEAISSVEQFATQTRELIAGKADQYKVGGWQSKRDRAMRIKQNNAEDDDITIVQREADKRGKGETVDQLVELQLTRARNLALGTSDIDGAESAAKTRIRATNDKTELAELMLILKQEAEQYIADLEKELAQN